MFFLTMLEYFPQRPFFRSGSSPGATASVVTLRNELMNPTFCVYMLGLLRELQTQASAPQRSQRSTFHPKAEVCSHPSTLLTVSG